MMFKSSGLSSFAGSFNSIVFSEVAGIRAILCCEVKQRHDQVCAAD
jgi:hypothetical protein